MLTQPITSRKFSNPHRCPLGGLSPESRSFTDSQGLSDKALVRLMAEGDKRALKLLYVRHQQRLCRFVIRLTGNDSTAEEVVNEVFLQAWRHADEFGGRVQVATWLMSIARFKAISECRRRSDARLDEKAAATIEDVSDSPSISMEKAERNDILQNAWRS